jgi:predicted RNase H-related nuclease YkuK (DUF458 family)
MFRNRFKKFGGSYVTDIVEYLKSYLEKDPTTTISVGCDSIQKRKRTIYACTIMLYNQDIRNGAHVVFFRENVDKIKDNFERLHKEAQFCHDISEFLNLELEPFYSRKDLNEYERKKYKFHLMRSEGKYDYVPPHQEETFIKNINLSEYERVNNYNLVDIHVDFNPRSGSISERGVSKNKSNLAYNAYVPWLRGLNYRVWAKPQSPASSSAADLLLQD